MRGVKTARRGTMAGRGAAAPAFDPFASFTWVLAAWANDPGWTPPADGAAVSSWADGSGGGHPLTQATGTKQPIFRASVAALNGRSGIEHDGSNDFLASSLLTAAAVPFSWVLIAKINTLANNTYLVSNTAGSGGVYQNSGPSRLGCYDGAAFVSTHVPDTAGHFIHAVPNSAATGKLGLDGAQQTGTTGTSSTNSVVTGAYSTGTNNTAVTLAFVGLYAGDITAHANWASFKAAAAAYYGLTIA